MQNSSLPGQLRSARQGKSFSQAGLAAKSGTSRVTIARLEAGSSQDFRLGTLDRLCKALDLEIHARPRGRHVDLEASLAREMDRLRRLDLRRSHAVLAVRLLMARRPKAAALVRRARARVDLWEREGLCSRHYSSRWRAMLKGSPKAAARALVAPTDWTDALFQNSPWSFALDRARL